jgi:hypothetical protein
VHVFEALHVLPKPLLPFAELAAPNIVGTQVGHDRVHDQELEWLLHHDGAEPVQKLCMHEPACACDIYAKSQAQDASS